MLKFFAHFQLYAFTPERYMIKSLFYTLISVYSFLLSGLAYSNSAIVPPEYYQCISSAEQAEQAVTSSDSLEEKIKGIAFFVQQNDEESTDKGYELVETLYRDNRSDSYVTYFYSILTLRQAGNTSFFRLPTKIRLTDNGLAAFEKFLSLEPENLEAKFYYMVSTIGIPSTYEDMSESILTRGEEFLSGFENGDLSDVEKERLEEIRPGVNLLMAQVHYRNDRLDQAKSHFSETSSYDKQYFPDFINDIYDELAQELT